MYDAEPTTTHAAMASPWLSESAFVSGLNAVHDRGYVIIENAMSREDCRQYRDELERHMAQSPRGRNVFEGTSSHRLYALLAKSETFAAMIEHPLALAFAEHFLGESCLPSACLSINLHPGESVQPWHTDDAHIGVAHPHEIFGVSVFWALDETTVLNGATEVLPYSHRWADSELQGMLQGMLQDEHFTQTETVGEDSHGALDSVHAAMPAGSIMIMRSDVWHRGGANRSETDRLIVTPQYCAGWARQLENMLLAVPAERARVLPKRTQELLGYSIHTPFMGYVDGMHPSRVLK